MLSYFLKCRENTESENTRFEKTNKGKLMPVCSYHVTYAFQSESTLYSCLNVKEILARNRHDI